MDKYLFSYAAESDPPFKRGLIRLVEKATGQPKLKQMYVDNQRFPRANESFWQAAVRSLALDVRYNAASLAAIPKAGPVVVVANHPYGVLDGIVISWLISKVRSDFVVLTNAVLMRAPEVKGFILPIDFSETEEAMRTNLASRAAARAQLDRGGVVVVFPAGGVSTAPDKLGRKPGDRRPLAALRLPAHPAVEGRRRSRLVRRPEQPAFPDRQPSEPDPAPLADLSRGQNAHRRAPSRRHRRADTVRRARRRQGSAGARRRPARPRLRPGEARAGGREAARPRPQAAAAGARRAEGAKGGLRPANPRAVIAGPDIPARLQPRSLTAADAINGWRLQFSRQPMRRPHNSTASCANFAAAGPDKAEGGSRASCCFLMQCMKIVLDDTDNQRLS